MHDRKHFEQLYAQGIFRGRDFVELLSIAFPEVAMLDEFPTFNVEEEEVSDAGEDPQEVQD